MKTDDLIRVLSHDLATPVRASGAALRRAVPPAFALMAVGWLALAGVRPDLITTGIAPTILKLSLGILLAGLGLVAASRLSRPEASTAGTAANLAVIPVAASLAVVAELARTGGVDWSARLLGHSVPACLLTIPLLAAVPLSAALFALRSGATTQPATTGFLAGTGAAGLAIVVYGLFCTEDSALFIATWYLLASAIAATAGAVAGRIVLRW